MVDFQNRPKPPMEVVDHEQGGEEGASSTKQVQDDKNALLHMLAHVKRRAKRDRELALAKELELQSAVAVLSAELDALEPHRPPSADGGGGGGGDKVEEVRGRRSAEQDATPRKGTPSASARIQPAREMRADEMIPNPQLVPLHAANAQHTPKRLVLVKHSRATFARAVDVDNAEDLQQASERQLAALELSLIHI